MFSDLKVFQMQEKATEGEKDDFFPLFENHRSQRHVGIA